MLSEDIAMVEILNNGRGVEMKKGRGRNKVREEEEERRGERKMEGGEEGKREEGKKAGKKEKISKEQEGKLRPGRFHLR